MEAVLRAVAIYLFLMVLFRISGRRSLGDITTFDFVLLLIISEATQQAMIDNDNSMTNAFLIVVTLLGLDIAISLVKQRSPRMERMLDGTTVLVIDKGKLQHDRMEKERVDENDILEAARASEGLERLDQIKFAILERTGHITIVPK